MECGGTTPALAALFENHSEGFFNRALALHGEAKVETCPSQSQNEAAIGILRWLAFYRALARLMSLRVADPRSGALVPSDPCGSIQF
jgi:hypothetical protein